MISADGCKHSTPSDWYQHRSPADCCQHRTQADSCKSTGLQQAADRGLQHSAISTGFQLTAVLLKNQADSYAVQDSSKQVCSTEQWQTALKHTTAGSCAAHDYCRQLTGLQQTDNGVVQELSRQLCSAGLQQTVLQNKIQADSCVAKNNNQLYSTGSHQTTVQHRTSKQKYSIEL